MSKNTNAVLGMDIGGSAIKTAPVDIASGQIINPPRKLALPDPATPEAVLQVIAEYLDDLGWSRRVGVGYPGVISQGCTFSAAHLDKHWLGFDLLAHLKKLASRPVGLINDADAAGLAEIRFGAGKKRNGPDGGTVLTLTFGTGIGSALFNSGQLLPNTEFGHMQLGDAEAEEQAAASVKTTLNLSWEEWADRVNLFLNEMQRLLCPDLIIIGGGISENFDRFGPLLKVPTEVLPAALGNSAGLVGAAMAVEQ